MKSIFTTLLFVTLLISCNQNEKVADPVSAPSSPLTGTWQLVTSQVITKGDTAVTFPVKNQEMIKIFTDNQFAFFKHDINKGQGENAVFDAGSGTYTLNGDDYAEHLVYCSARGWEDQKFNFKLAVKNDSLIQKGIEKIDSLNIDHEIVEIYKKVR